MINNTDAFNKNDAGVLSIHRVNCIELYQSGTNLYQTITVNGIDLLKIITDKALEKVEADENGNKKLNFWGSLDIVITQNLPEEQDIGQLL